MEKKEQLRRERTNMRETMQGDNLIMYSWAIFSPESHMDAGPKGKIQRRKMDSNNNKVKRRRNAEIDVNRHWRGEREREKQ